MNEQYSKEISPHVGCYEDFNSSFNVVVKCGTGLYPFNSV